MQILRSQTTAVQQSEPNSGRNHQQAKASANVLAQRVREHNKTSPRGKKKEKKKANQAKQTTECVLKNVMQEDRKGKERKR